MGYQVWVKDYGDNWILRECETEGEAKAEILDALKRGQEPKLTREIPFELKMSFREDQVEEPLPRDKKVKTKELKPQEESKSGATESQPTDDQSTGG